MGRWKLGPQGAYYDANDSGPSQASPEQIAAAGGGAGQGGGGGALTVTQPGAPASGGNQSDVDVVKSWYQAFLGRPASDAEAQAWASQGLDRAMSGIANSPEAQAYAQRRATPPPAGGAATPPTGTLSDPRDNAIKQAYNQYLGRDPSERDLNAWRGNPDFLNGIKNSPEAQYFATNRSDYQPPGAGHRDPATGDWLADPVYGAMEGVDVNKLYDTSVTSPKYIAARILASGGTIQQAAAAIGATVLDGTRMKLATGETIDTRRDDEGANALQWLVQGDGGDSGGAGAPGAGAGAPGAGGAGAPGMDSSLLAGFTRPFVPPGAGGAGSGGSAEDIPGVPQFNYPDFQAGAAFRAPTGDAVFNDPGYQFRVNEAQKAFTNSAGAKGVLRSGGTLKDFLKYGQEMASQEYGNVYARAKGEYDSDFNRRLTDYTTDRETAAQRYAPNLSEWSVRATDLRNRQDTEYDRAWEQYKTEMDTYYKNQKNAYDRLYGTTALGSGAIQ